MGYVGHFGSRLEIVSTPPRHCIFPSWNAKRTVVVDHNLDIAENLAVSTVSLVARLRSAGSRAKHALGLRVEHEGDSE